MIDHNEWLTAMAEADTRPPVVAEEDAITTAELAILSRCGESTARKRLARFIKEGKAERVTKLIPDSSGRLVRVSAYRLIKATQGHA